MISGFLCHSECSEESRKLLKNQYDEIPHCVQNDKYSQSWAFRRGIIYDRSLRTHICSGVLLRLKWIMEDRSSVLLTP